MCSWRAIVACRTAALGGHVESCDACGTTRHVYHSCRNRHCPRCQTRIREAWLAARQREVLPVPYFHLVFTLLHDLNGLIGQCPRALYEMLFAAVSATLAEFAANPRWLGGKAAFTLVLRTWKQGLGRHVHIHALVPGGALKADGNWVAAKRGFLFPTAALRGDALLTGADWGALLARLYDHDWVVYARHSLGGPEQVLDYLGRYTHRVAISNERIRHYGLLGPAGKAAKLARARAALSVPPPDPLVVESVAAFMGRIHRIESLRCPHCANGSFVSGAAIVTPNDCIALPHAYNPHSHRLHGGSVDPPPSPPRPDSTFARRRINAIRFADRARLWQD